MICEVVICDSADMGGSRYYITYSLNQVLKYLFNNAIDRHDTFYIYTVNQVKFEFDDSSFQMVST